MQKLTFSYGSPRFKIAAGFFIVVLVAWLGLSSFYSLSPINFVKQAARVLMAPIFSYIYREDLTRVEELTRDYRVGNQALVQSSPLKSWHRVSIGVLSFHFLDGNHLEETGSEVPFVYENANAEHLVELRTKYHLEEIIKGATDEYDAMLRLGGWLGNRWDHGKDDVPGGRQVCKTADVIKAGESGARFWCEIAAKVAVQAATALNWQARLVTISTDGYTWEHAVAEFWSNKFAKWFVIDTDFNVVCESSGIPLSAFELCHEGEKLQEGGQLNFREIAPSKPSLPMIDLVPLYRYIHIDMRNDWCSRPLNSGSPAGGELSTWWTSRPSLGELLTAKNRLDDSKKFNWVVNSVAIHALSAKKVFNDQTLIEIGLTGYSPVFKAFEVSFDGDRWRKLVEPRHVLSAGVGKHVVRARMVMLSGCCGPVSEISFKVSSAH